MSDWPIPVGPSARQATVLTTKGVSKEERLENQLAQLHNEHVEKVREMQTQIYETRSECSELQSEVSKLEVFLQNETSAKERAMQELEKMRAALKAAEAAAEAAGHEREVQESLLSSFGDRVAAEGGETAELREELARKELEVSLSALRADNAKLQADMEKLRAVGVEEAEAKGAELDIQNAKLSEQLEQLEEHCLLQQQLRRDAQLETSRLNTELANLKDSSERNVSDAIARQKGLQEELTQAQRRCLNAQRQLDEMRIANSSVNSAPSAAPSPPPPATPTATASTNTYTPVCHRGTCTDEMPQPTQTPSPEFPVVSVADLLQQIDDLKAGLARASVRVTLADELEAEADALRRENALAREMGSELQKLKQENKRLVQELRGDGGAGAALVPLPNHKGLPVAAVRDEVLGALQSVTEMLGGLEKLKRHSSSSEEECAFMRALLHKTSMMLRQLEREKDYSKVLSAFQATQRRLQKLVTRLGSS